MESYTLKTAFPRVRCSETLGDAEVLNITADSKKRIICADAMLNDIVEYAEIKEFVSEVKETYELADFQLNISFHTDSSREIECVNYCVDVIGEGNPLWRVVLDSCVIETDDECIKIILRHGNRELLENEEVDREISAILENRFGMKRKIVFDVDEMTVETSIT